MGRTVFAIDTDNLFEGRVMSLVTDRGYLKVGGWHNNTSMTTLPDIKDDKRFHLMAHSYNVDRPALHHILLAFIDLPVIARIVLAEGSASFSVWGNDPADMEKAKAILDTIWPRMEQKDNPNTVPVTFWTLGPRGPSRTTRTIDAPAWTDIVDNYSADTKDVLGQLMGSTVATMAQGKLILWHGPPGTGKSFALRAIGREWSKWASLNYIVDPENFFGPNAQYMTEVILTAGQSPGYIDDEDDEGNPTRTKWCVLVLEDTGELLTKDAKLREGQALSRLLNLTDGMIGQGLRILVLITTNEDVGQFHDAVTRPGRTIANIKFDPMTPHEIKEWLEKHNAPDTFPITSLADLYSTVAVTKQITNRERKKKVGFN